MKNNLISEVDRIKNLMLINEASGGVWDSVIAGLKSITRNDSVVVRELDDILTNVKAGRINPTDLVNKLFKSSMFVTSAGIISALHSSASAFISPMRKAIGAFVKVIFAPS
jgi:hypothetical protein